ncbi:UBX domain-containing protein 2B isoform X3 [Felis catus]|uniref:UBX domain-containing protein 2B isoform X3 n=1 Tax=Felis catus TaxID=9685 RepID=UPI001D19A433|nr:UBX domain-containing protein 2B isoform X3 [Felis catus]
MNNFLKFQFQELCWIFLSILKIPSHVSITHYLLALAELYEDEVKCKSSKSDRPNAAVFKSPRTPPQRFYSSEREYSGLHIVQPSTGKIVSELFKEAREHGAVPLNEATRASGDNKSKSFTGGGYRLGNSFCKRSEYIYGENQLQDVQILLKLWSNGFSLDDGELRPYHDPPNAQFLESVKKGEIPLELQRLVHGGHVNLDMEDRRDQEYIKPRLRFKAFSGEGQKLGRYLFQRRPVSRCLGKHYAYSLPRDVNAPIGDLGSTCLGCSDPWQRSSPWQGWQKLHGWKCYLTSAEKLVLCVTMQSDIIPESSQSKGSHAPLH